MDDRKIMIAIVDDHPIVREGLEAMFSTSGRFEVTALFESGREVVDWCWLNGLPDVILTDVRMPEMDGFALLAKLRAAFPKAKVLMLAGLPNADEERRAREAGAAGYVSKTTNTRTLAGMVARIASGESGFASDVSPRMKSPFTPRERETLKYLALGKTREEVAAIMGCGSETIKSYTKQIRDKLDAPNTAAAIARAYELGYITR